MRASRGVWRSWLTHVLWEHEIAGSNPAAPTTRPREGTRERKLSETASALRATSDALIRDLERLAALERQKREMQPEDVRLVDLAAEVESLALRVLGESVRQRELTEDVRELVDADSPNAPTRTIAGTPREIHAILADWREAERRAAEARSGSAEARAAKADIDRLRGEYRAAHEDAKRKRDV